MKTPALILAALLAALAPLAFPADVEEAYNNLKEAVSQKDAAKVKQLASEIIEVTVPGLAAPEPKEADEKEAWTQRVAWYKDIQNFAEYSLYSTAVQGTPEVCVDLLGTLEQRAPKSKYMDMAYAQYFQALTKTGAADQIPAVAERALKSLPDQEDALAVLMNAAWAKDHAKALGYADRLINAYNKAAKPEGMADADWQRKKAAGLGQAYYIGGMAYAEKQMNVQTDRYLRAALPYIKGNEAMMGAAYFYLGLANYGLGVQTNNKARVLEAAKFSEQAAAVKGQYSQQAWRNVQGMRDQAQKMR